MILDLLEPRAVSESATLTIADLLSLSEEGLRTPSGESVGAMTPEGTVRTCIKIVSETVAMLPVHVRRSLGPGKSERVDHRVGRALQVQASRTMTGFHFRESMTSDLLSWGNGYALQRFTNSGELGALDYFPASNVLPERSPSGGRKYLFRDGKLGDEPTRIVEVPASQVFHLMWHTRDGIRGLSPIMAMADEVGLARAQLIFAALFFGQGASVSHWIKRAGSLDGPALERLRQQLVRSHGGARRAHRIGILDEGMDIVATQANLEELQLVEQRGFSIARIAAFYGMTPDRLNIFEKAATFASLDATEVRHVKSAIQPVIERWESTGDTQLLHRGGDWEATDGLMPEPPKDDLFLKFSLDAVLRGDPKTRAEVQMIYRRGAILSANEVRAMEDWNEIDGGDRYYVEENMRPVELPYPVSRGGEVGREPGGASQESDEPQRDARAPLAALRPVVVDACLRMHVRAAKVVGRAVSKSEAPARDVDAIAAEYYARLTPEEVRRELGPIVAAASGLVGRDLADCEARLVAVFLARGVARSGSVSLREEDNGAEAAAAADFVIEQIAYHAGRSAALANALTRPLAAEDIP